jgi:4-aminobutyrate aminotransferase / (S)-3-amino-2-methylpropionate transaminase / 5-aminovalerate transaminase
VSARFGSQTPRIVVPPPGPESRRLAGDLRRFESPNVTYLSETFPVFWEEARGCNVRDVDGNVYVDLTAAFAVAAAGHAHPEIVAAVQAQAAKLMHGMGDVHPPAIKVEVLRALAEVTPAGLRRSVLANSGAEAVEAALKTVAIASGRPRVLAFRGSYHGLTLGALAVSGRDDFRLPFLQQLADTAVLAPFPEPFGGRDEADAEARRCLAEVERLLDGEDGPSIGAILVEPIQGRGGDLVPGDAWLPGLREICDRRGLLLVLDEIYTGFGRTGRWFACEHWGVVPDLLVVGKALTGGMPFAACVGTDAVMDRWPVSRGEALHTSTFLGHPLGCAAALASIAVIRRERLVEKAAEGGAWFRDQLSRRFADHPRVADVRGLGMMIGMELVRDRASREPDPDLVGHVMVSALRRGFLLLGGGLHSNVISFSPPLGISRELLGATLEMLEEVLATER